MANYTDIFPVSSGSSTLNGLTFDSQKSADFTGVNGKFYDITATCTMTMPSSPSTNDKVGFILTSATAFRFNSTDKFNGSFLATDYVKKMATKYNFVTLTYSGSTNGWIWDSQFDSLIINDYIGTGFSYYRFSWNGNLSEIQVNFGTGAKTLTAGNGVSSLTAIANVINNPSFAAISDGVISTSNNQYIGTGSGGGSTYAVIQAQFSSPVSISSVYLSPQWNPNVVYNAPTNFKVSRSSDSGATWTETNNISVSGMAGNQLTQYSLI